ncbi:MAG: DoxX family protein [Gammaproteobacteria bacterium]|nr:DoxX family protein [Gammaproteobacteria bacterium]
MQIIVNMLNRLQDVLDALRAVDFLGPLALRLYLAPVFWVAGTNKLGADSLAPSPDIVSWFGNPDWGLGLPAPELMAWLATYTEIIGAVLLLLGLAVRWVSIPLMVQMLVATFSVHWENGWQAVADPMSPFPPADIDGAMERLDAAKSILQEHGNYDWLTGSGSFVISNNGIEWAVTYFVMLLALFFVGAGRWLSVDHWIHRGFRDNT